VVEKEKDAAEVQKNVSSGSVGGPGAHFLNNGSNAQDGKLIGPRLPRSGKVRGHGLQKMSELQIMNLNARNANASINRAMAARRRPPIPQRPRRAPPIPNRLKKAEINRLLGR